MKLREIREAYEDHSRTCSNSIRNLALSGIAISWLFIKEAMYGYSQLLYVLAITIFVFTLFADLIQYYSLSIIWHDYYNKNRGEGVKEDDEVDEPEEKNTNGWFLYTFKLITLAMGYAFIIINFVL